MTFKVHTGDLHMLARAVSRGDEVDPGQLRRVAIAVIGANCNGLGWWDGSRQSLAIAVRAYVMASTALEADELKRNQQT